MNLFVPGDSKRSPGTRWGAAVAMGLLIVGLGMPATAGDQLRFRVVADQEATMGSISVTGSTAMLSWSFPRAPGHQQLFYSDSPGESCWRLLWDTDEGAKCSQMSFDLPVLDIDLSAGLVAHYRLNGDGGDESTNRNHGVVSGAVHSSNRFGVPGQAMHFDGTDDWIDLGAPLLETADANHELTLSAWILPFNVNDDGWILSQYVGVTGNLARFTWGLQNGRLRYFRGGISVFSETELEPNQWVHIATSKDASGTIRHYVNGRPAGSGTLPGAFAQTPTRIGGGIYNGGINYIWLGVIDDLRVFNRALNTREIRHLSHCPRSNAGS